MTGSFVKGKDCLIRLATLEDFNDILSIYDYAREFMKQTGNPTQWKNGYPGRKLLEKDIEQKQLYVFEYKGNVKGVFAFVMGNDPHYSLIEEGSWLNEEPYGAIHRIAGNGEVKGLLSACVDFCKEQISNLRIDTHENNKIMQHQIQKCGFTRCGIIYSGDGKPRIAYQGIF